MNFIVHAFRITREMKPVSDVDTEVVLKFLMVGTCRGWGSSDT